MDTKKIFVAFGKGHRRRVMLLTGRRAVLLSGSDPIFGPDDGDDPKGTCGLRVRGVRKALETMEMTHTLGYRCGLFIDLKGCPYCDAFRPAWNAACMSSAEVVWMHADVRGFDETRRYLGTGTTFPCLVVNGTVHASVDAPTSRLSAEEIVKLASAAPAEGGTEVEFIEDLPSDEDSDTDESVGLLTDRSSEHSGAPAESEGDDLDEDDASDDEEDDLEEDEEAFALFTPPCANELDDEDVSDDDEDDPLDPGERVVSEKQGFAVCKLASPERRVECYFWRQCGGCHQFRPRWNSVVHEAAARRLPIEFDAIDIDEERAKFQGTGSQTVPHIVKHHLATGVKDGTGPVETLFAWITG